MGLLEPGATLRRHTLYPSELRARGKLPVRFYMGARGGAKVSPVTPEGYTTRAL
jgi:hypothetical protein